MSARRLKVVHQPKPAAPSLEDMERQRDHYRDVLSLVLGHMNGFANIVGQEKLVSRRIATGAVDVMAGLIEEALGR